MIEICITSVRETQPRINNESALSPNPNCIMLVVGVLLVAAG